jgi:hypothetical protein
MLIQRKIRNRSNYIEVMANRNTKIIRIDHLVKSSGFSRTLLVAQSDEAFGASIIYWGSIALQPP